jgi:hypothetical protein
MSRENVELLRGAWEDYLAGKADLDAEGTVIKLPGEDWWDPAIEWDASEARVPDLAGVYQGKDAVRRWWREWLAAWETLDFEYELVDAGDHVVALIDHQRMRGRSTDIEVSMGKYAQVATFREGLMVHWKVYLSQSEALEAVGLHE